MLYKPTNPSPYNSIVDKPAENTSLTFTASCVSTSGITGMRLAIKDNTTEYYLPIADNAISQCKTTSGITIPYRSAMFNSGNSYSIKTSNFTRTDGLSNEAISKIIQPLTSYRWQIRLYQGSADINIAYGFVQTVINFNNSSKPNRRIIKVRPHTNMFMGKSQRDESFGEDDSPQYNKEWNKNLTEYYDDKVVYKIQFSGKSYDILNYYYSKEPAYYVGTKPTDLISEKQYDEPLFAYIEIDIDDGDTIETGAEYTILTNYIDSNEYYFSCRQLSEVKFRGRDDSPINEFTSIDELDTNPDSHIYSPTHSNVQIKGSFDSSSSATINYYRATLYQVLSNGEDIQIHDSGYVYSSAVDYDCKDLLSGNTYKLIIAVTDTYGNTVSKGVYIQPNCSAIVKPELLTVEPYREHGSIVLDFSKLISITGVESDGYNGGYTIYDLTAEWAPWEEYTGFVLSDDTTSRRVYTKACEIEVGNTITWSKYDGVNKYMKSMSPLISTSFSCTGKLDKQTIFELAVGNCMYKLTWEVYQFHLWIGRTYKQYTPKVAFVLEDGRYIQKTIQEETTVRDTIKDEYYNPYKNKDMDAIHTAMTKSDLDYSVPYLMHENMPIEKSLFMHTENIASDCWWHVIVTDGYWYMKCIYSPDGLSLKYESNWIREIPHNTENITTLTLYGGCTYCNARIDEYGDYRLPSELKDNPLKDLVWGDDTIYQINFTSGLSGGNFDGGFQKGKYASVDHFRIYKKYSNQPQLHKVFETDSPKETIIEDFTVGCRCPYKYYIVPVCYDTNGAESVGSVLESEPIELDDGIIRVIGLIQDPKDLDTYYIDADNIWHFSLNITNSGFQNNMGKTYNDTPEKYPVEVKNKGFYRSFNINGLLGRYDCDKMDYVDTYDDIIEWENFVDNGEMKLVIDLRGIQTIGTMESNGIEYDENGAHLVSANFSIKQLEDINNVTILNRRLLLNPNDTTKQLLYDADGLAMRDSDDKYLIVKAESEDGE